MKFVVSGLTVAFCFWMWMRYQDTDKWRYLVIGGVALVIGLAVHSYVRGPVPYGDDELACYRFRGNECL
ncbi:MAG: hypothetical protein IBJ07_12250 [Rhizobiaceae bacterium]|nr:hypothetical protein [Rhizobiaceae bacterium]